MDLARGKMVTPAVRLVKLLGEGGMGSVWVAHHVNLKTQVAVKFVSKELLAHDESSLQRFNREAALSAQIKSPHVVQIFDHGVTDDGMPFIVMELLEGETLAERIERQGALGLSDTRVVITQTAKALAKAHKVGIVHRDIKPDNIFLVEPEFDLFIKVLDFGIAKQTHVPATSRLTQTGAMVGTPEFMSPEQALSAKNVDHRSDLWALGVVAYYSLTGCVPFSGETLGSLCVAIAAGEFTPISQLKHGLPPTLDDWFNRALAIEVDERFQSARELAVRFGEALGPLGAPPIEDQFSQVGESGPVTDWLSEDSHLYDSFPPDSMPPDSDAPESGEADGKRLTPSQHPTVALDGKDVKAETAKGTPTFSGASMAANPPGRRMSRVALWSFVAAGLAAGAVVGIHYVAQPPAAVDASAADGGSGTAETDGTTSHDAATEDEATAELAADADAEVAPDGAAAAADAGAEASAEPTASVKAPIKPRVPKPVATAPRPRPSSTASASEPADTATANASATEPPLPPDRGF